MIKKEIYTCWFSETNSKIPPHIQKCIESQKIEGYTHHLITLHDIFSNDDLLNIKYVRECFNSKHSESVKYVKLTDYVRMYILYNYGGIFLDADIEVLKNKNFDSFLETPMFIGKELSDPQRGLTVLGVAVIGCEPKHPLIKKWMEEVERDFRGDDNLNYESSMDVINRLGVGYQDKMTLLEPDYFYPYNHFTSNTNITNNTIAIHHFNRSWAEKNTLQIFKQNIVQDTNFIFVKRGDGEEACMNGDQGGNCDGHPYSQELGKRLKESFEYLSDKANIVMFDNQQAYNVLLHRIDSNLEQVKDFYTTIKNSSRKKIFIAPKRLSRAARILNAQHIEVPEINAFVSYAEIFRNIPIIENAIYLFCAGMPSKLMIADLVRVNLKATYLDCGSAFDPIIGQTRTFQISKKEIEDLYRVNNFSLAQETHPERLYVLNEIGNPKDKVIYDLGCGGFKVLPEAIGVDIRPVSNITGSIDSLPFFNDCSADVIISKHSLEHILDQAKTLKEWIRVLKTGGKMIIVLPDHGSIDTIDPFYSNGEHLHAYSMETLNNFLSLFPEIIVAKQDIVLDEWSFGTIAYKLPTVSIIIPQLGREDGLAKCLDSIRDLDYPKHLISTHIIEGNETVPKKVKSGVEESTGEYIVYAANDMTFDPQCLKKAIAASYVKNKALVSFNEGELYPDKGNICTHFLIKREFLQHLDSQEIFCTDFTHAGVDNYLWAQADKLNQAYWCEEAKITHNHFSKTGMFDDIYKKGWRHSDIDQALLAFKLTILNNVS